MQGERLGKEKSGDLIMKRLANLRKGATRQMVNVTSPKQDESTDMILNRLISGSGIKRKRKPRIV